MIEIKKISSWGTYGLSVLIGMTIFVSPGNLWAGSLLEARACEALMLNSNGFQLNLAFDFFRLRYKSVINAEGQPLPIEEVYFSDSARVKAYGDYFDNNVRIIVQGAEIATLTFRYLPSVEQEFDSEGVHVNLAYQGQKLFRLLATSILLLRPHTQLIRGTFDNTNYADFKRARGRGLSNEDAIRQTHSYKTFAPYGFENFAITNYSRLGQPEVERYRVY